MSRIICSRVIVDYDILDYFKVLSDVHVPVLHTFIYCISVPDMGSDCKTISQTVAMTLPNVK
jgi:hypothetical protein